ncbi:MAG: carboxypeptidase regulatory-like domain-containing protein [Gemmatimonadetes bacterium]|nr:carboxypeptidase regulatory-like domain-containing protein [Gemmatimonadota bacterium]
MTDFARAPQGPRPSRLAEHSHAALAAFGRRSRAAACAVASVVASVVAASGLFAGGLSAQSGSTTLSGRVFDKTSRSPVVAAEVVQPNGAAVATDSIGRFTLVGVPLGTIRLVIRATGFPITTFDITVNDGLNGEPIIQIDSTAAGNPDAQPLPEVTVITKPSLGPRYADFERRQKTGRGQYLTREQIERSGFNSLQETLRTLRGVQVDCGGGGGCYVHMARAPMRCLPEYIVDDRVDNVFGIRTPMQDIQAIEVYTGPADVPGEYAGRNAGCGVIVIWTRSGPPVRRRP